jgi:hypothetical protein
MPDRDAPTPKRRRGLSVPLAIAASCIALYAASVTMLTPRLLVLDDKHRSVVNAIADSELHELPGAEPQRERLSLRRTERAVVTDAGVAVVQTSLVWNLTGAELPPLAQTAELFGVDRLTRTILPGYGDRERSGSFGFPPDAPRGSLRIWDAFHPGPVIARYEHTIRQGGIALHRYHLEAEEADASAIYAGLQLVPERYRVLSSGRGWALVEPRSGLVVDRAMTLEARFVLAGDRSMLGRAQALSWRYSEADRSALLAQARAQLRWLDLVQVWLPRLLALGAAFAAAFAALRAWLG